MNLSREEAARAIEAVKARIRLFEGAAAGGLADCAPEPEAKVVDEVDGVVVEVVADGKGVFVNEKGVLVNERGVEVDSDGEEISEAE